MARNTSQTFGEYTSAKLDFLAAAGTRIDPETGARGTIGVNRRHCRPLHPHGLRMVRDGLMKISRNTSMTLRCRHTVLTITDDGVAELARLQKREAKTQRRHEMSAPPMPQKSRSAIVKSRQTRAIAFMKEAVRRSRETQY